LIKGVKDKVVLITGASTGIGKACAIALGRAGAKVALAARSRDKLASNSILIKNSIAIPTDLTREDETVKMVDRTVEVFGRIDVLVNNAAMVVMSRADSIKPDILKKAFETNVIGSILATNHAVKYMRKQGAGHIINIESPGFLIGLPFLSPYAITKAAMFGWTRCIQAEWADTEIFITQYLPGYIKTETVTQSEFGALGQDVFEDSEQNFILKKLAKPKPVEKVANDIVRCVARPKRVMYSSFGVQMGTWLSMSSLFRKSVGRKMAKTFCKRMNMKVFK